MPTFDFVICGAGPIGLYAACLLHARGHSCCVLEKNAGLPTESRAIGIHPPSLQLFAELNLADVLIGAGCAMTQARVHVDRREVATLDFSKLDHPFPLILSLPQADLLRLLHNHLTDAGVPILWQHEVATIFQSSDEVAVRTTDGASVSGGCLLACDGAHSRIRSYLDVPWCGKTYADTYLMGDVRDETSDGEKPNTGTAAVYLGRDGLVESFPLPSGQRRWVIRQQQPNPDAGWQELRDAVAERTGRTDLGVPDGEVSFFHVHGYSADALYQNRVILLGDAAHVVSPIGGQGMNLGWLRAHSLLNDFNPSKLPAWQKSTLDIADRVRRQAVWNMRLGRPQSHPLLLAAVLRLYFSPLCVAHFRRRFTMTHL